jgi:hypothetical protein
VESYEAKRSQVVVERVVDGGSNAKVDSRSMQR